MAVSKNHSHIILYNTQYYRAVGPGVFRLRAIIFLLCFILSITIRAGKYGWKGQEFLYIKHQHGFNWTRHMHSHSVVSLSPQTSSSAFRLEDSNTLLCSDVSACGALYALTFV
jgi:hypothetical protein